VEMIVQQTIGIEMKKAFGLIPQLIEEVLKIVFFKENRPLFIASIEDML
jgi:hypothetical protein